tara:strand:+ start:3946 stop:4569 length:624 start_codon:yes stop_codon:yes gene_type:complete
MNRNFAFGLIATAAGTASAATVDFTAYTNNSGNTAGISTSATLASTGSSFSITIQNSSSQGYIGVFYMETHAALSGVDAGSVAFGPGPGVDFKLSNGAWNGPGGTAWGTSFIEVTKDGGAANGIHSGEFLTLTFSHDGSFNLDNLIAAINADEIDFALHYQAWTNGESEKLLNNPVAVVPLPPAVWAGLGMMGTLAGVRGYRRARRG